MKLSVHIEDWELKQPFRITGKEWTSSPTLVVELTDGDAAGRGEGQGIFYTGETVESMFAQVESVAGDIERGISQAELLDLLPAGGARNAVD